MKRFVRELMPVVVFLLSFLFGGVLVLSLVVLFEQSSNVQQTVGLDLALPESRLPTLPPSESGQKYSMRGAFKGPAVVNFWASWCHPCAVEHSTLLRISQQGVPIYGVLYQDEMAAGSEFLRARGSPFEKVLVDNQGVGVEIGITGIPETLVIDAQGIIRGRWTGALDEETWEQQMRPLYLSLKSDKSDKSDPVF
ncbi:MAG: redoxin family protein [Gammaproteobacteria bacterium]